MIGLIYAVGLPISDEILCRVHYKDSYKDYFLTADQINLLKDFGEIKIKGVLYKCEQPNLEVVNDKYQSLICNVIINNKSDDA